MQTLHTSNKYAAYVEAIETAIDADEADALCKALIN